MPIEDFIITIYCCVADLIASLLGQVKKIRTRGFAPKLTDAEVVTMEIVGEFLGIDTDKGIWEYFRHHWSRWFPHLGSRSTFVRQAANLWAVKQSLQKTVAEQLGGYADPVHLVDGYPMPVCHFKRARRSKVFKGEANYGHCAAKSETYYGFHGHLSISFNGIITGHSVTPANGSEREALWETSKNTWGLYVGDKGYLSEALQQELKEERQIDLQTALRKNMNDSRPKEWIQMIKGVRRKIETVIGQLTERFHIEKVRARDLWHLTNRQARKILAHTMSIFMNVLLGREYLQFEGLIQP
jgi:hypothetical protein